jgi:hypothetical protein
MVLGLQIRRGMLIHRISLLCGVFVAAGCVDAPTTDLETEGLSGSIAAPGLIAPLSATHATTSTPTLAWQLPRRGGLRSRVEICRDRACGNVVVTYDVRGETLKVDRQLPAGVVFWRVKAVDQDQRTSPPSATWELWTSPLAYPGPGLAGPPADTTWGSVLDVDGDGYADLAISDPYSDEQGYLYLHLGGPAGPPDTWSQALSGQGHFGTTLASAGDVDGDGLADLAVATGDGVGTVDIFYGVSGSLVGGRATRLAPGLVTSEFGATMSTAGDVNRDGYADLLVGGHEVAQIYLGGPTGISTTSAFQLAGNDYNGGLTVSGGGDVNGDRIPDLMVGGWSYLGTGTGFVRQTGYQFLDGNFVGDVNGDGLTDYAGYDVHRGTPSGLSPDSFWVTAGQYFFGAVGDANGDGFDEIIANVSDLTGLPPWRAYYGRPFGGTDGPQNEVDLPGAVPTFAAWTAAGDLNGDSYDDVAVGVPEDGAVYLFMGPDVPTSPTRVIAGPGGPFGTAVE